MKAPAIRAVKLARQYGLFPKASFFPRFELGHTTSGLAVVGEDDAEFAELELRKCDSVGHVAGRDGGRACLTSDFAPLAPCPALDMVIRRCPDAPAVVIQVEDYAPDESFIGELKLQPIAFIG